MKHTICATIFGISKKPENKNERTDYKSIAALSVTSNNTGVPENITWQSDVENYWSIESECSPLAYVEIELPDGVEYGKYPISLNKANGVKHGLHHSTYRSNDGKGATVILWTKENPEGDTIETVKAAVDSGILASVPTKDGKREIVPVKVLNFFPRI